MKNNVLLIRLNSGYIQARINGEFADGKTRFTFSCGIKAKQSEWNRKKNQVKSSAKDSKYKNERLILIESALKDIIKDYLYKGVQPSTIELREQLKERLGEQKNVKHEYLLPFYKEFISSVDLSKSAEANHKTCYNILTAYEKLNNRISFESVNIQFFNDFILYLQLETNAQSKNYILRLITDIKRVLDEARKRKFHTNIEYKDFKYSGEDSDAIYLTDQEINRIYQLDLSESLNSLSITRDMFVIGCMTGLRYSDFKTIKPEQFRKINNQYYYASRNSKTNTDVFIPCNQIVVDILNKYDFNIKAVSYRYFLSQLKELGEMAGIDEPITLYKSKQPITKPKYKWIGTHTARRSFATNAYLDGIDTLKIRMITGHTTEKTLLKYIKVTKEQNAILLSKEKRFINPLNNPLRAVK